VSSIGGPNIVENGLVLSYDVANTKSFRGIPTTNLFGGSFRNFTGTSYSLDGEWPNTTVTKTFLPNLPTPVGLGATLMTESTVSGIQGLTRYGGGGESGLHSLSVFIYPLTQNITEFTIGLLGDSSNMIFFNLVTNIITYGGGISNRNAFIEPVSEWPGWYRVGANFEGREGGWVGSVGYSMNQSYAGSGTLKSVYITGLQYEYTTTPTPFTPNTRGANVISGGGVINQSKINSNNGTISNPFASPEEAQKFGYPAGNYYFKSGSMGSAELLEFAPNYYEGKPFCCVFRSPYRSTATTNKIGLNIPMGGLLVQRDTLDLRAAVYWSAPITYNSVGGSGNNTADSGHTPRRVILGFAGGHGIFATNQDQCSWGSATGAIGAGWDGSTCGSFPNDLIWGTGRSDTATYENRSGVWSHWITWTDFNAGGELINGVTFSRDNQGSFLFDGVNDYINIPTFTTKPLTQISCECWIRPNKPSIGGTIRGGAISSTNSMYLGIIDSVDGGNTFAMHWANQTTNSRLFNWNGSVPNNQWSHLVGTYNGSIMRAYLNGIEIYSVAQTGTIPDATYVVGTYGVTLTDVTHNFHGRISNVKIYNVGLTANEVLQNYNATKGRFGL
jgi:hypothetical protein